MDVFPEHFGAGRKPPVIVHDIHVQRKNKVNLASFRLPVFSLSFINFAALYTDVTSKET